MTDSRLSKLINKFAQQTDQDKETDDFISQFTTKLDDEMSDERSQITQSLKQEFVTKYPALKDKCDRMQDEEFSSYFTPEEQKIIQSYELREEQAYKDLPNQHEKIRQQQREFDDQDDEINQFQQTENDNKLTLVKSREGKSPFTQQDASTIVNSLLPSMKSSLTAQKLLPATLNFTFNTTVTASSTNPKVAALLRRDFQMPLELAFKHYLITNKKYLSAPVTLSISA